MKNEDLEKKIKRLSIVSIILAIILAANVIFTIRIGYYLRLVSGSTLSISKGLNDIIRINKIDTSYCKYLINDSNLEQVLGDSTGGLKIDVPKTWSLESSEILKCNYSNGENNKYQYTIVLNVGNENTFEDFANSIYDKAKAIDVDNKVYSFDKAKGGYFEVNSFSDAIYNNLYYDYSDGESSSTRVKVKILNQEEQKQVRLEIE